MKILSIDLAKACYEKVKNVLEGQKQDYRRKVDGLGSMIIKNGLYATLLFLRSKSDDSNKDAGELLCKHIRDIVKQFQGIEIKLEDAEMFADFCSHEYIQTQKFVLEVVKWLKRYARILIPKEAR